MTLPTVTVMIDWGNDGTFSPSSTDNVTNDVLSMQYRRGANFDGTAEAPGSCLLHLRNDHGYYSPDYSSGPNYGNLRIGRPVWITATYSGTTYGIFYGVIRRLIPLADKTVEIYAEDPLGTTIGRRKASVALSKTRSIRDFRGAVLDFCGVASGQRSLAYGVESNAPVTFAAAENALAVLEECNTATGSIHFARPDPVAGTHWKYVTIDRTAMQVAASAEAWNDERIVGMDGWDLTDEAVVNEQWAAPIAYERQPEAEVWEWSGGTIYLAAGTSRTIWAPFAEPVLDITSFDLTGIAQGVFTSAATYYGDMAKIVLTQTGPGTTIVTGMTITGTPYEASVHDRTYVDNSASKTAYGMTYAGNDIESRYLATRSEATGIAEWLVARYATAKPRPTLTKQDHFPSLLAREVGDVITLYFARLSVIGQRFYIRSLDGRVDASAGTWFVTYGLERALETDTYLTLDVAGKGLDDGGAGTEGKLAV